MPVRKLSSSDIYRAVEHHHFIARRKWLLFDVNGLRVMRSCRADGVILEAAASPIARAELVAQAVKRGFATAEVRRRVAALIDARFLLLPDQTDIVAKLGQPTSYATFMVNVSQRCNLTCPYCYVNKGHFDYAEKPIPRMQEETAEQLVGRIFENFPGFATYGYHFYGGEPLMNFKTIEKVVASAETMAARTQTYTDYHITTNGTLLTRDIADFMDRHQFTVYFSIDGDKERHDELRTYIGGGGSYADVERNLDYLRSKPGVHLIGSSVIRQGLPLREALKQLESHGARQCKAERVRLRKGEALALEGADHDDYIRDIDGLIDHYISYLRRGRKPMDFRLSSKILQVYTRTRRNFFCPAGDRMFGISSNGEIYPCALHVGRPQSKLGDIAHGLDRAKQQAFRAKFSPENQKDCRTCWTRHLCGGGCSAMVDRFGHEDCRSLRAESEAAIAIFQHFADTDPLLLLGLVSPKVVRWANGELADPEELMPTEAAARRVREETAEG
ncbi:MAG TPA: radical SAM protein [Stellaceae bacterium]|nr:radical SAM protein [Stellaceae bacterium]